MLKVPMRKNTDKYTHCTNCAQLVQQATLLALSGGASPVATAFRDGTCAWACFCQNNREKRERRPRRTRGGGSRFQLFLPENPRTGAFFPLVTQSDRRALFFACLRLQLWASPREDEDGRVRLAEGQTELYSGRVVARAHTRTLRHSWGRVSYIRFSAPQPQRQPIFFSNLESGLGSALVNYSVSLAKQYWEQLRIPQD